MKFGRMIWEGYVIRMRKIINAYTFLVWKPKGKRRLDRRMGTRKDNIKMWIRKTDDRLKWRFLVNAVKNFRVK
jgi:hypothetical protein